MEELRFTEDHEWVRMDEEGLAIVGITDFAQKELGELVYVEVETVDESLPKGEVFGSVEAVKTTSDLFMPISGKIVAFNDIVSEHGDDNPAVINEDPYGDGWIIKIEPSDPSEWDSLMNAEEYEASINA